MTISTTTPSHSEIRERADEVRSILNTLLQLSRRFAENATTKVVNGDEPYVTNIYALRSATILESHIEQAVHHMNGVELFIRTIQRWEENDGN